MVLLSYTVESANVKGCVYISISVKSQEYSPE